MPNQPYPTTSSLNQGTQFAKMTTSYHGGAKKTKRSKNRKMHNGRKMKGGSFTPYAEYPTAMDSALPQDLREMARISPLDASFTELPAIEKAAGVVMKGGYKNKTKKRGGSVQASINAPTMLLTTPQEEEAARLNPQWYTENTVIPNFRGPLPTPVKGGKRKSKRNNNRRR
jgi:hypothetical protein